jgi:hypothetical protein
MEKTEHMNILNELITLARTLEPKLALELGEEIPELSPRMIAALLERNGQAMGTNLVSLSSVREMELPELSEKALIDRISKNAGMGLLLSLLMLAKGSTAEEFQSNFEELINSIKEDYDIYDPFGSSGIKNQGLASMARYPDSPPLHFYLNGTLTGRFNCQQPNVSNDPQTMPREISKGKLKLYKVVSSFNVMRNVFPTAQIPTLAPVPIKYGSFLSQRRSDGYYDVVNGEGQLLCDHSITEDEILNNPDKLEYIIPTLPGSLL